MEPIPRPLSQKLALTLLVGAGCFLTGLVFWFSQKDTAFFLLSSVIFLCSCIRAASLFRKIRGKSYLVLEGICTSYCPKLFVKYREIYLLDSKGVSHTLLIGRDYKIRTGCSYRFYFLSPPDSLKEDSPWLEKAMLADSLLGMELLENVPVSGTASPSNMDL